MNKNNEYSLFNDMMMEALNTEDIKAGFNKSLKLLRCFLDSTSVTLFCKKENGLYSFKTSDNSSGDLIIPLGSFVNKISPLIEQREIYKLDLDLEDFVNMMFLFVKADDVDCIVCINNCINKYSTQFWKRLIKTFEEIIKRELVYEKTKNAITMDLLTGLKNSNSYEMRIKEIKEANNNLIVGLFGLFRLKYINDNYTHACGDIYLKESADILKKYWPLQYHSLYRIGGDEFILLTDKEDLDVTKQKALKACSEASRINLGVEKNTPIGINYGIVYHNNNNFKDTFIEADKLLSQDKKKMYMKYNIDRRR